MNDPLSDAFDAVVDESSFVRFVELLLADRRAADSLPCTGDGFQGEWANQTIADFLEAALAWANSSSFGERPGPKPDNPWELFAIFLSMGQVYE